MSHGIKSTIVLIVVAGSLIINRVAFSQGCQSKYKRNVDSTVVVNSNYTVDYFRLYSPRMQREVKVLVATPPSYR